MIRRYNYTGRKRLSSDNFVIRESQTGRSKTFELVCDLKDKGYPDEAKIFVEPYFKSSYLRFDFGTVARFQPPVHTDISDLPTTDQLWYRIKIVDEGAKLGLILATVDVKGTLVTKSESGKQSILPVDFVDSLGKRIWSLDFRTDRPYLVVNESIPNIREKIKSDDAFFSLVYPEVIKRIALKVAESDGFFEDELSGWASQWMKFFSEVLFQKNLPEKDNEEAIDEWCNDISDAFARKYGVLDRYNSIL